MNKHAVALMIVTTIVMAFAQLFYKLGSLSITSFSSALFNVHIWVGLVLYGVASGLLILSLRMDKLNVLYPFMSLSYVWVLLLAFFVFGELLHFWKVLGVVLIMIGVSYVGMGNRSVT